MSKAVDVQADGPFVVISGAGGQVSIAPGRIERIEVREFTRNTDTVHITEQRWAVNVWLVGRSNTVWNPSFSVELEAERIAAAIRHAALEAGQWRRG